VSLSYSIDAPCVLIYVATATSQRCNILVKKLNNESLGYVSPTWDQFGQYGALQQSNDEALLVTFSYSPASLRQIDFMAINAPSAKFPYLGAGVWFSLFP
jgi:hypothetical protein